MCQIFKKKCSFVLLEIMIALALVTTALLPFFHYPFDHMQQELKALFEMELEAHAQNRLVELQTMLWKKELSEERLFADTKDKSPLEIKEICIELSPSWKRRYEERVYAYWKRQKLSDDRTLTALACFKVEYRPPKKRWIILRTKALAIAQKRI